MAMSPRTTRWVATTATLVVFLVLAFVLATVLRLEGGDRVALLAGLSLLGALAAGLAWYVLRPADAALVAERDDALLAVREATGRLPRGELLAKPTVLVLGPAGATKTTVVGRSGLDPQLLAGDALGPGQQERPTTAANVWLAKEGAVVEAAGPLLGDGARFARLVRRLRAPGLAAALGRGRPAMRAVVLAVPCDLLVADDGGAGLDALAPTVRERLADVAREFGLDVPVYVLFTRADRIPHFEAWASPLTRDEVRVPLGAALPFDDAPAGTYAERLVPRLEGAFRTLVAALAARRGTLLAREGDDARRLAAYEFPRELAKVAPLAVRFLVEATRPSQLGASARLRGVWFTGVRPVVVRDAAPAMAAVATGSRGATAIFDPATMLAPQPAAAPAAGRRVPEWSFLERFFGDVVFGDRAAEQAASGGVRVAGIRRLALGGAIAATAIAGIGVVTSWLGNRALATGTLDAARAVAALPVVQAPAGAVALPSVEALRTLETLRARIDTVVAIDTAGAPLSLGLGLWQGAALADAARPAWVAGYRRTLHDDAWRALVDSLRALPDAPTPASDYGRAYGMLRTYLVGTASPARATPELATPVLLASWQRGAPADSEAVALATRQFDAWATRQAVAAPWPATADAGLVAHARDHLARFAGIEPIYASMLAEAGRRAPTLVLAQAVPQAAGVVGTGGATIPGAFTAEGWRAMRAILADADRFFQGETWVVGDRSAVAGRDRARDLADIRARYVQDYVAQWRAALKATSVGRGGSVRESAARLGRLGGAQSPLLAVLAIAARNTEVDTAIARAFQPVHAVTPPAVKDKYVSEANQEYVNGLLALQGAMEQLGNLPPVKDTASWQAQQAAAQQALTSAIGAKTAARQVAQTFAVDPDAAAIGPTVASLLEAPIAAAEAALRTIVASNAPVPRVAGGGGAGGGGGGGGGGAPTVKGAELAVILNDRGRQLCKAFERIEKRFPFNPDGGDADLRDVGALLAPGTGSLWSFYDERLVPLLPGKNGVFTAKPALDVTLDPKFVEFFNRMARASLFLFADRGPTPRTGVTVKLVSAGDASAVALVHGDRTLRFAPGAAAGQPLAWPPTGGTSARLLVTNGGREREVAKGDGNWALFRLVARASSWDGRRATFAGASPVVLEFTAPGAGAPLGRGALAGPACVAQVTQ